MSSLLKVCLAVLLTASLGLWLPWPGEARLGTRLELRPMKIQTQGLQWLPESQSVSGVLDSLTQALTSAVQSVIDFISSQLRQEIIYGYSSLPPACLLPHNTGVSEIFSTLD